MDSSHDDCEPRWVLPDRVLSAETDRQLTEARRMLADLQVELASVPAVSGVSTPSRVRNILAWTV